MIGGKPNHKVGFISVALAIDCVSQAMSEYVFYIGCFGGKEVALTPTSSTGRGTRVRL